MPRESIYTPNAPKPASSYAQAVKANGVVYVTGSAHRDPASGEPMLGEFEAEFRQSMKNSRPSSRPAAALWLGH